MFIREKWRLGVEMHKDALHDLLMKDDKPFNIQEMNLILTQYSRELFRLTRAVNRLTNLKLDAEHLIHLAFTFGEDGLSAKAELFDRACAQQGALVYHMEHYDQWLSILDRHTKQEITKFQTEFPKLLQEATYLSCRNYKAYLSVENAVREKAARLNYL